MDQGSTRHSSLATNRCKIRQHSPTSIMTLMRTWFVFFVASFSCLCFTNVNAEYPGELFLWTPQKGTTTTQNSISNSKQVGLVDCPEDGEHDFCGMLEFCDGRGVDGSRIFGYRLPCTATDELSDSSGSRASCECLGVSGPLIRLQPGKKYKLTLRNAALSSNAITNIHTHGLHIVGDGDSDDVTRRVNGGGNCLDYTWHIDDEHSGGTYWYHAHHHGSTEQQVQGGAYGMLIVEDNKVLNPDTPAWAQNELLLQVVETFDGIVGNGKAIHLGDDVEMLPIKSNIWYRLRLSMVSTYATPTNITFVDDASTNVICDIHKVASDGVWRSSIPGPKAARFELTGVSRADFAIRCKSSESAMVLQEDSLEAGLPIVVSDVKITYTWFGEEQHFASLRLNDDAVIDAAGDDKSDPAILETSERPDYSTMTTWTPNRPYALEDMRDIEITNPNNTFTVFMRYDNINDVYWDPDIPLTTIGFDRVHEWKLFGIESHPFHIHLYHVQVMNTGCGTGYEIGEFYDTIAKSSSSPADGDEPCIVRFRTADIGQRCVVHCHVLFHEDNGSMGWVNVLDDLTHPANGKVMKRNDKQSYQYQCPALLPTSPAPSSSPSIETLNGPREPAVSYPTSEPYMQGATITSSSTRPISDPLSVVALAAIRLLL